MIYNIKLFDRSDVFRSINHKNLVNKIKEKKYIYFWHKLINSISSNVGNEISKELKYIGNKK